jgi:excisionase family DNA binding protein
MNTRATTLSIVLRHIVPALQAIQRDIEAQSRDAAFRDPVKQEPPAKGAGAPPSKKFFKLHEAAEYLGISKGLLYKLTSTKQIPFYRIGKRILASEEQLLSWLEAGGIEAPASPSTPGTSN